jgi:hypothetical protein
VRTTDIFALTQAQDALDSYHRLIGPGNSVSQALRMHSEVTRMHRYAGGPALAKQQRVPNRTVRAGRDDSYLGMTGLTRAAVDQAATSASHMAHLGLRENLVGVTRATRVRAWETGGMLDRQPRAGGRYAPVSESLAHAALARAETGSAARTTRTFFGLDDALVGGPLASIGAAWDAVGVGDVAGRDRAARRTQRHELAIKARVREATAVIDSVRLAGPMFGLAHAGYGSAALNGWQRAQLRNAQRELQSVRAMAMNVPGLARRVQRQLAEVRTALDADRLAAQQAASVAIGAGSLAGSWTGVLAGVLPKYATDARAGSMPSINMLADTSWLTREAGRLDLRTLGWFGPADLAAMRARDLGSGLRAAAGMGGMGGGSLQTVVADLRRLSRAYPAGRGLGLADVGSLPFDVMHPDAVLDALGDVVAAGAFDAVVEEEPSANEQTLAAVVALVMWSRAASSTVQSRGQLLTTRGRLLIAQTGAVLQELGVAVADEAERAGEWVWTEPLWPVRALRAVSAELTAEERLALRQRRRQVVVAVAAATSATILGPHFVGSPAWLFSWCGVWAALASLYEDIARVCHAHDRDELVPADQRWWT